MIEKSVPTTIAFAGHKDFSCTFTLERLNPILQYAKSGYLVYELMSIRRPIDLLRYLDVDVDLGWELVSNNFEELWHQYEEILKQERTHMF